MASGLIRWVGTAVLLCGGLAAALLPPTGEWLVDLGGTPRERTPEKLREVRLSVEVAEATELLARRHWIAGFREVLERESFEDPAFVALGDRADSPPEAREEWRRRVRRETDRLPAERDGTGLAVFFLDSWHDLPGGYRHYRRTGTEYYLLEAPRGPVCVAAVFRPRWALASDEEWRRGAVRGVLGPCALLATHGLPGPGVNRWLEEGGYVFMDVATPSGEGAGTVERRREAFGIHNFYSRQIPFTGQRCLAGRLEACREWITAPGEISSLLLRRSFTRDRVLAARTEMISRQAGYGTRGLVSVPETHLMADLEAEFGPDRFRRFWRSSRPMPEAFDEAFGEAPERWMRRWAVARYGKESSGPRLGMMTAVLSILTLGATFLVGAWVAERRTVD